MIEVFLKTLHYIGNIGEPTALIPLAVTLLIIYLVNKYFNGG